MTDLYLSHLPGTCTVCDRARRRGSLWRWYRHGLAHAYRTRP